MTQQAATYSFRRMANNSAVALVGKLAGSTLGLFAWLLLNWLFLVQGYGLFAFAMSYVGIFAAFGEAGLHTVLVRELARDDAHQGRIVGTGLCMAAGMSLLAWLGAFSISLLLPAASTGGRAFDLILIYGFSLLVSWNVVFDALFRARLLMIVPVSVNLLRSLIFLIVMGVLFLTGTGDATGLRIAIGCWLVTAWGGTVVLMLLGLRMVRPVWGLHGPTARLIFQAALPLWISRMAIVTYYWIDTMMLGTLLKDDPMAVGIYNSARKFPEALALIPAALTDTLYPVFSRLFVQQPDKLATAVGRAWILVLWLALPMGVLGYAYADTLFLILPGEFRGERSVVWPFRLLLWAEVFVFLNILCFNVLNACDRQNWNLRVTVLMMLFNIVANVPLITHFAEKGASVATLVTEALGLALELTFLQCVLQRWFPWGRSLRVVANNVLLGLAAAGWVLYGPDSVLLDIASVLVLGLAYVGLGYLTGCIDPAVWREILGRFRRTGEAGPASL